MRGALSLNDNAGFNLLVPLIHKKFLLNTTTTTMTAVTAVTVTMTTRAVHLLRRQYAKKSMTKRLRAMRHYGPG